MEITGTTSARFDVRIGLKQTTDLSRSHKKVDRETEYEKTFNLKTGQNFNEFYKKYHPKLVWQIKMLNITDLDAEDISNQAFMRALDKIDTYDPQWNFSTWLFTIGKRIAYMHKKVSAKHLYLDIEQSNDEDWSAMRAHVQHKMVSMDDAVINNEYELGLQEKYKLTLVQISKLPEKYKRFIELCDIQGKSYNEIMEITQMPLQTVKNRIFHGRNMIERAIGDQLRWINDNV